MLRGPASLLGSACSKAWELQIIGNPTRLLTSLPPLSLSLSISLSHHTCWLCSQLGCEPVHGFLLVRLLPSPLHSAGRSGSSAPGNPRGGERVCVRIVSRGSRSGSLLHRCPSLHLLLRSYLVFFPLLGCPQSQGGWGSEKLWPLMRVVVCDFVGWGVVDGLDGCRTFRYLGVASMVLLLAAGRSYCTD